MDGQKIESTISSLEAFGASLGDRGGDVAKLPEGEKKLLALCQELAAKHGSRVSVAARVKASCAWALFAGVAYDLALPGVAWGAGAVAAVALGTVLLPVFFITK